jgi:DNA-binding MarR family transcriptional regulator
MAANFPTMTIARLARLLDSSNGNMSLSQYRVLGLLSSGDERATVLAARLAVAKPTLTALIDSLVDRRFVLREGSAGDRRSVVLSITAAGRDALADTQAHLGAVLADVVSRCEDPVAVVAALDSLGDALDARWAQTSGAAIVVSASGRSSAP